MLWSLKQESHYFSGGSVKGIILLLLLRSCDRNRQNNMEDFRTAEVENTTSGDEKDEDGLQTVEKQEPTKSGEQDGKESSSKEPDSTTAADDDTKKTEKESEKESSTKETAKETTKASETTKESTTAKESETQKPTDPTTPASTMASIEPATTAHTYNWIPVKTTVHHPEETKVVHHEAETTVVHHKEETTVIHHEEVGHYETVQVEDSPAWDEPIYEKHMLCNTCGFDFTANSYTVEQLEAHQKQHMNNGEPGGWGSKIVITGYIHHDATYTTQQQWIVDTPAWDETKVTPAWDETIVTKPAWDSTDVVQPAWDEEVVTGYKCSVCGEVKN